MPNRHFREEIFPNIQSKHLLAQFEASLFYLEKETESHLPSASFQGVVEIISAPPFCFQINVLYTGNDLVQTGYLRGNDASSGGEQVKHWNKLNISSGIMGTPSAQCLEKKMHQDM